MTQSETEQRILSILNEVKDPEIPVVSIVEMGMISGIHFLQTESRWQIVLTPTFVGCPAISFIKNQMVLQLKTEGIDEVEIIVDLETPWDSNRITTEAKQKLEKFGLAPPVHLEKEFTAEDLDKVRCPHCKSTDTTLRSAFGSTLCRAIRFCFHCKQGFEQFKPI